MRDSICFSPNARSCILDAFSVLLFFIVLYFLFDFRLYPYADDWIYVAPLAFKSVEELLKWAFTQHVDHIIPLQKLFHYFILRLSGYDFRILVALNAAIALLISLILLRVARIFRGEAHWGDLIIPFCVLNPSSTYSLWAFQFQFLSSVFFVSVFLYFSLKYLDDKATRNFYAGAFALFLSALCGMNGLIFSVTLTMACLAWYFLFLHKKHSFYWPIFATVVTLIGVQVSVLLHWKPSAATDAGFQLAGALKMFVLLQASGLSIYMFSFPYLKSGLVLVLFLILIVGGFLRPKKLISNPKIILLYFVLMASELILVSIAIGRSRTQGGWNDGLAMHYGMLAMLIPILIWVLFCGLEKKSVGIPASVLVVLLGIFVYKDGLSWRRSYENSIYEERKEINIRLNTDENIESIVDDYISSFNWKDDEEAKETVLDGLRTLRKAGYPHYRLFSDGFFSYGASGQKLDQRSSSSENFPVEVSQITDIDGWIGGGDYSRSKFNDYVVYGSYVHSDRDKGRISVSLKKGQSVYYRTGPSVENQHILILAGKIKLDFPLLTSEQFREIKFNGAYLPESFTVVFEDGGDEWGAWCAIAVHK